ncbi:HAMP domain-containing histidine kinase [Sulfurimonas sp. SAG-AH-194-C21]|nr:ATP-binding protein [Sulfurimonas sp. SAG-AH-194-C21]MDF1882844.1 HAMP domain-containing histidine kinase [Sulfurimonas sp. SAG-AH-194-C21]
MNPFSPSLINKIKFLGFILALLMLLILFIAYGMSILYTKKNSLHDAIQISSLLNSNTSKLNKYLQQNSINTLTSVDFNLQMSKAEPLITDSLIRKLFEDASIELFTTKNRTLFLLKNENEIYYFQSSNNFLSSRLFPITILATLFFIILFGIYYYITSAFKPLVRLNDNIDHFLKFEEIQISYESATDEIANVANAFYNAIEYNKKLKLQKDMYICSIMHEISTPLTKAKFITYFMENEQDKNKLNALFNSMQEELDKIHELESINTKLSTLKLDNYSLNRLVEDICDVLLLEEKNIEIIQEDVENKFDYSLFIIAIKNLIDNAVKYSKDAKVIITIKPNYIEIKNLATDENSSLDMNRALKPFKRGEECSSGMGLGLFLVNEIITRHNFTLEYNFSDTYHIFKVNFYV